MTIKKSKYKVLLSIGVLAYLFIIIVVISRTWGTSVDEYQKKSEELCNNILKYYEQQVPNYELSAYDGIIGIKLIFDDRINGEVTNDFTTDEMKIAYEIYLDIISSLHKPKYLFVEENTKLFYVRVKKRKRIDPHMEVNLNYYCGEDVEYSKNLSAATTCKWSDLEVFTEMNQVVYLGSTEDVSVFKNYNNLQNVILNGARSFSEELFYTQEELLEMTQKINEMFPDCKVEWRSVSEKSLKFKNDED